MIMAVMAGASVAVSTSITPSATITKDEPATGFGATYILLMMYYHTQKNSHRYLHLQHYPRAADFRD